jgi:lysozyme family protein
MVFVIIVAFYFWNDAPEVVAADIDFEAFRDTVVNAPAPPPIQIIAPAPAPEETPAPIIETMAQFQTAYDIVRKHEGGFQIMPEDSGNYNSRKELVGTNWGINAQVYEQHIGRPPSARDMRDMPRHVALSIFKQIYWDRINGDQIKDQQVANIYFDGNVNHGRWGIQMMQRAAGVTADGLPGPLTLAAINSASGYKLFTAYKDIRRAGYHDLVRRRPKDQRFLRGWLIRINSFVYQGGGLILPTSGGSQSPGPAPATGGISAGVIVAVVVAVAFMFSK